MVGEEEGGWRWWRFIGHREEVRVDGGRWRRGEREGKIRTSRLSMGF